MTTTMKTYSTNGNAGAAARVVLGAMAQRGVHFTTTPVGDGSRFTWAPIEGAPLVQATKETGGAPAKKAVAKAKPAKVAQPTKVAKAPKEAKEPRRKSDGTIGHQPGAQKALALIRRAKGVTIEGGAATLGMKTHSFRAIICRLSAEYVIDRERIDGKMSYTGGTVCKTPPSREPRAADEHVTAQ